MQKTEAERLALIELAKLVGQFPFLEADINPLIVRLVTKGNVTQEVSKIAQEQGMGFARPVFRKLYFNQVTLTEADTAIRDYCKENNISLDN